MSLTSAAARGAVPRLQLGRLPRIPSHVSAACGCLLGSWAACCPQQRVLKARCHTSACCSLSDLNCPTLNPVNQLQKVLLLDSVRAARRRLLALALLALAGLGATLVAARAAGAAMQRAPRYVLVVDAGSSGTRMFAYAWRRGAAPGAPPLLAAVAPTAAPHAVPRRALPGKRAYQRVETEPGLDAFADDPDGLRRKALGPLLEWAEAVVPPSQWAATPLFLFGTAGLRKLG